MKRSRQREVCVRTISRRGSEVMCGIPLSRSNPSDADRQLSRALDQWYVSSMTLKALKKVLRLWDVEYDQFISNLGKYSGTWSEPLMPALRDTIDSAYHEATHFEGSYLDPVPQMVVRHMQSLVKQAARRARVPYDSIGAEPGTMFWDRLVSGLGLADLSMSAADDPASRSRTVKWINDYVGVE